MTRKCVTHQDVTHQDVTHKDMTRKPAVMFLGLTVVAVALPLFGQEDAPKPSEVTTMERVNFPPGGTIRLNGTYGYLTVEGWDEPQVEVILTKSTDRFYKPSRREDGKRRLERVRIVTERLSATELSITTIRASRHGDWAPPLPPTTKAGVTVEYQIRAPRDSHIVIHHDTGYVFVSDLTGDIEATSHSGDIMLMLPAPGPYAIDAKTRMGSIVSDFAGAGIKEFVVGTRFARAGQGPSRRIYVRMGRGSITIKQVPPPWSPKDN